MKYSIQLNGIHCTGCTNLIKMTLEEIGLQDVNVSLEDSSAHFRSDLESNELNSILDAAFLADLKDYKYSNLNINA